MEISRILSLHGWSRQLHLSADRRTFHGIRFLDERRIVFLFRRFEIKFTATARQWMMGERDHLPAYAHLNHFFLYASIDQQRIFAPVNLFQGRHSRRSSLSFTSVDGQKWHPQCIPNRSVDLTQQEGSHLDSGCLTKQCWLILHPEPFFVGTRVCLDKFDTLLIETVRGKSRPTHNWKIETDRLNSSSSEPNQSLSAFRSGISRFPIAIEIRTKDVWLARKFDSVRLGSPLPNTEIYQSSRWTVLSFSWLTDDYHWRTDKFNALLHEGNKFSLSDTCIDRRVAVERYRLQISWGSKKNKSIKPVCQ